jgi:HPt (histidine-containing phosphotransfer) domain-containing protein
MTGPPLIDRAVLDELFDAIGADGARSVLEVFITECRKYLVTIAAAAAQPADAAGRDLARRAAHSLKSGAAQIGAPAISAAAAAIEQAAGGTADLGQEVAALRQCAAATEAALQEVLRSGDRHP